MQYLITLIKGIAIGFAAAVPIGPIGIMCVRKSIFNGKKYGFITGLGAATADMIYGIIAVFGATVVVNFLLLNSNLMKAAGGVVFIIIAIRFLVSDQEGNDFTEGPGGYIQSYFSTLFLTLTNPMTVLAFITILTLFGIVSKDFHLGLSLIVVTGIFLGSASWFFILTILANYLGRRLSPSRLLIVNRVLGIVIGIFGILIVVQGIINQTRG